MRFREGDFIESEDGLIFDVKGLVHPRDSVIAFPRYFRTKKGDRERKGIRFKKVYSLAERYALLKARFGEYLVYDSVFDETMCEVPLSGVTYHYDPIEELGRLLVAEKHDILQSKSLRAAELLKQETGIMWDSIGVSGSILLGLHTKKSDIDIIVYGSSSCKKAYSSLKDQAEDEESPFVAYNSEDLKTLFDFRSKDTVVSLGNFVRTERRKVMQGKFSGIDYFFRFLRNWDEIGDSYGDIRYRNLGDARIMATISDDSESIFTPCSYSLQNVSTLEGPNVGNVSEIASFRGRFCEQAKKGESVVAQGKLERVTNVKKNSEHLRLLIGSKPSDFMILR